MSLLEPSRDPNITVIVTPGRRLVTLRLRRQTDASIRSITTWLTAEEARQLARDLQLVAYLATNPEEEVEENGAVL